MKKPTAYSDPKSKNLFPDTEEYIQKSKQLNQVKARIDQISAANRAQQSTWERLTQGFNKYFGIMTAGIASITGLTFTMKRLNEEAAKIDDIYSDVRKTTGLTLKEVKELNNEFKKLDTRTSREQLNMLARDAGKLGISSKKDVMEFVRAADQIQVALGEDLGEGAIRNIGKISDVFGKTKELGIEKSFLAIGSSINELGQNSTANESYIVDFTKRLSGVGAQANISIQDIMGFASALDQSGQAVEMSATAMQKFIMKMFGDPAKFAKMAGKEVKDFTTLLQTDANKAIITVLQALHEKGGFSQLVPIFKDMGLDGARAVGVLSAMASNIEAVTEAQALSNKAFAEASSLTKEFNVKNDNRMAKLEKARKIFKDQAIVIGEKLSPAMLKATNTSTLLIKSIGILFDFFVKYGGVILKTAIIIGVYTTAVKLQTLWTSRHTAGTLLNVAAEKLKHFWTLAGIAATQLYAAVTMLLTGNIKGATTAIKLFFNVIKTNPIALIVSLIAAAGIALYEFSKKAKTAGEQYAVFAKDISEASKQHIEQVQNEKREFNNLVGAITNVNTTSAIRAKLIQELKEKYPEYLKFINTEKVSNNDLLTVLQRVNDSYSNRFKIAAIQGKADAYSNKVVEMETRRIEIQERLMELSKVSITPGSSLDKEWERLNEEDRILNGRINIYTKKVQEFSAEASKMQASVAESFTAEGIAKQIEQTIKHIEAAKKRLESSSDEHQTAFYTNQLDKLLEQKSLLEKQLEAANTKKTDGDKKLGGFDDGEDLEQKKLESAREKRYKAHMAKLEAQRDEEKAKEMQNYIAREINYQVYLKRLQKINADYYDKKASWEKVFDKSDSKTRVKALEEEFKKLAAIDKEIIKNKEQTFKALEELAGKDAITNEEKRRAEIIEVTKSYKAASDALVKEYDNKLISEEEYQRQHAQLNEYFHKALAAKRKKHQAEDEAAAKKVNVKELAEEQRRLDRLQQLRDKFERKTDKSQREKQLRELKEWHKLELDAAKDNAEKIKEVDQQYSLSKLGIDAEYFAERIKKFSMFTEAASGLQDAWSNAQHAQLEADKESELAAAGDNAEKRQADVKFAIQVGQIIASTALAIMQGFAQLGPIGGAISAVMLGATGIAQVAAANAERQKVKSMTLNSTGGSSGKTERVRVTGFEDGGYWVEREQDGKMFNADYKPQARGFINKPTVLVSEAGAEFVANAEAVNNPTVKPTLDIIDIAQKQGTISTLNLPAVLESYKKTPGKETGGYVSPQNNENKKVSTPSASADPEMKEFLKQNISLLQYLKNNGIDARVVLSDLEKKQNVKKQTNGLSIRI